MTNTKEKAMAKPNFRNLNVGDRVRVQFMGSAALGNESHVLELKVESVDHDAIDFNDGIGIYFSQKRWRYGTSGEVARLLTVEGR